MNYFCSLMFKMTKPRYHHGQAIAYTIADRILIADRPPRLNECSNTCSMCKLNTIIKWEKCITGQYSSVQVKIKLNGFFN